MDSDRIKLSESGAIILERTAVIADLHLGIESALEDRGVAIPSMQVDDLIDSALRLVERYDLEELIVAGDLKHEFSRNVPGEWRDVRKFIESLMDRVRLKVVRGNHDNYLAAILSDYGVELVDYTTAGSYTVIHGHRDVGSERVIMGHEHPSVRVRHEGAVYTFRCYLHAKSVEREVWVLPAFSPFFPGSNVLELNFLSPVMKGFEPDEIELYAVEDDVYYMGNLKVLAELL